MVQKFFECVGTVIEHNLQHLTHKLYQTVVDTFFIFLQRYHIYHEICDLGFMRIIRFYCDNIDMIFRLRDRGDKILITVSFFVSGNKRDIDRICNTIFKMLQRFNIVKVFEAEL